MHETLFSPSGVRLRKHSSRASDCNWLLLPGGPGIGSESLQELADCLTVEGSTWLVDLPGDGSNPAPAGTAPFANWPHVVVEAARMLPNVVFVGHSTGGMYLLATPELERHLIGLVLIDTAPDASWHKRFVEMTVQNPLPAVDAAAVIYAADKRDANIAALAVASAEWNFMPLGLEAGRQLLARMPYNSAAIEWSEAHFDHVYTAAWWPETMPILVLAGSHDRIVSQHGWADPRFHTPNATFVSIADGGHFPWIENPSDVRDAFKLMDCRASVGPF